MYLLAKPPLPALVLRGDTPGSHFCLHPFPIIYCQGFSPRCGIFESHICDDHQLRIMHLWLDQLRHSQMQLLLISRYRWKMQLWDLALEQVYLDDNCYAYQRGTSFVAIVTNGQQSSSCTLSLTNMEPGVKLCNVLPPHPSCNSTDHSKSPCNLDSLWRCQLLYCACCLLLDFWLCLSL